MKKTKLYKFCNMLALAAIAINAILPVANIYAVDYKTEEELKASAEEDRMRYDFVGRARVKAYFNALQFCGEQKGASAYYAINGKWGKYNDGDGDGNYTKNIYDSFLAYVRGYTNADDQDFDCSEGNLIKEAFDEFFKFAGDSRRWNKLSLKEKEEFFCDSGWMSGNFDGKRKGGDNAGRRQSCSDVINLVGQGGKSLNDWGKYTLYDGGNQSSDYGIGALSKYLKEKVFHNMITPIKPYYNAELYEVLYDTTYFWCAKRTRSVTVEPEGEFVPVYYVNFGNNEITGNSRYFPTKHEHYNAYYAIPYGGYDHEFDCTNPWIKEQINTKNTAKVKAAIKEYSDWLSADCFRNYEEYYASQGRYYDSLSDEQKTGDKLEYVGWFNQLPSPSSIEELNKIAAPSIEGKPCFETSDDSPFATCRIEEYIKYLQSQNPDPDSPAYQGFSAGGSQSSNNSDNSSSSGDATCYSGAGSLGWILCPILEGLADATAGAYKDYIEPALQIDPVLIGSESDQTNQATYNAWDNFRIIADTIFTIFILVVIFSQLTGYGIDNYGIKKILPKLIVTAILVNLSFLICQLAVDLSNILGSGLNSMMNDMGNGLVSSSVNINGNNVDLGSSFLTGVAILVGIVAIAGALITNGLAILLPLLMGAISIAVSIAFLFVLLAVRQAGVIVLVVISPLAFICYILPNTKKLFDKWLKAFEGLLLLYPICGLLVGGGNFVSKLILSTGAGNASFFMALISMIVCIVPIFFIPVLLKGSFAAMGNIGATISGFGKRAGKSLGGKAGKAVGGSDTFRRANNFVGRHTPLSKRRRAMAAADTDKRLKERESAQTILTDREFKNKTEAELQSAWNDAFDKGGDHGRLAALTNVMTSRYGSGAANFMAKTLANKNVAENKNAQDSMQILRNTMMTNSTLAGNMKNKASDAFQMISNAGITGHDSEGNTTYANLDYYSKNNAISKDVKDWSTQSSDTLKRAIESGTLKQDTIEQILNSNDPSIQSGIQSDPSKAEVLQAAMGGAKTQADFESRDENGKNKFVEQYKAEKQQQINDAKTAEQKYREDTLDALNKINEQLGKH